MQKEVQKKNIVLSTKDISNSPNKDEKDSKNDLSAPKKSSNENKYFK